MRARYLMFFHVILVSLRASSSARWRCSVIPRHRHNRLLFWRIRFSHQQSMTKWFRFQKYTPYSLGADCQSDWNKLWGKSRCGYTNHHHHQDSDRFVWRAAHNGQIELAAYAYDNGRKPFQNEDTLLKKFVTTIAPGQRIGSKIEWYSDRTDYSLFDENGILIELLTIEHENVCLDFQRGYELGFYFGGNCRAPDRVSVCFQETSDL